ncbi:DnaA regulatory inactivator Hda [Chitiniphilus shinanonensis]|uniref:DnaA regulatory inactivator Hda n=1 Tax=Chitiniphilus shinanonensis TaxID=553088 RepID=A0ABQ6BS61_9NEIS|nr:DnaA regulatory inactivator Hda [Chitiniphilus shinanonensis]GLS04823.1 DnaA regulatory inactivator Hda [Chitiniphilus shinanonensis]
MPPLMQQLVLDLQLPAPPSFEGFVRGDNAEPLFMLGEWLAGAEDVRFLYLWGEAGVGKSYLLAAAAARCGGTVIQPPAALPDTLSGDEALIVDGVDTLGAEQQIRLFDHYNTLREGRGRLLASGRLPPMLLPLRDDLTTRLGWGLVYQLKALSDADKVAALKQRAVALGFDLSDDAAEYLLRHATRDLPALNAVLERANVHALSLRRPVTVPLLREVLGVGREEGKAGREEGRGKREG